MLKILARCGIMVEKSKGAILLDRSEFVEVLSMRNEINEPAKNNLPNDMIDWDEISEFIIDMLDPKYRGNKGWKVINDTSATSILKENSVIVLKMLYNDLYGFFYKLPLERNIVWYRMEKYIREKYSRLSDEALSLIIRIYHIDDR